MEVWGLIDTQGRVILEPQYYEIGPFRDGIAEVKLQDMKTIAFIDTDGKRLFTLPKEIVDVGPFSDGLALANVGGKWDEIDGAALQGGKWGYIDRTGAWAIKPRFELNYDSIYLSDQDAMYFRYLLETGRFSDGRAAVQVEGGWGFIDRSGALVIPGPYTWVEAFHAGHTRVMNEHDKKFSENTRQQIITLDAVINTDGEVVWETDWSAFN